MATRCLFGLMLAVAFFGVCQSNGRDSCFNTCAETFTDEFSNNRTLLNSCRRGCRFYKLMELDSKIDNNKTEQSCTIECCVAYKEVSTRRACQHGCEHQSTKLEIQKDDQTDNTVEFLYPMLQVHRIYSRVFDSMWQQFHVQWSYFLRRAPGNVIIIKSRPNFIVAYAEFEMTNDKTPQNIEMNLQALDQSATPNLKHSQVRSLEDEKNQFTQKDPETYYSDWLRCMSHKTGMPHIIILMMIVVCVCIMTWLCFTATSSGSSKSKKLSINGDLQFMKEMGMEKLMKFDNPHDRIHGNKIPFKIKIEQV